MNANADTTKQLQIYLQDHRAGSTFGVELAKRAANSNEGTPTGKFLARLVAEIEADVETLEQIMDRLDVDPAAIKNAGAWVGEKLGRLKLNSELSGPTPLGQLIELEGLYLGITGKRSMWENLRTAEVPALESFGLDGLIASAQSQLDELEPHRLQAARDALGG